MREIALASQIKNKQIIDYLQNNINKRLDFCNPIITNYCDNNFCYILFACEDDFMCRCESILREIIIEYIENVYKVEYLKSKIKNPLNEDITFNVYIKVLSIFDKTTDENALKNIIFFNQTFFVDSFLEFRLVPLKSHWDNLATLSSDNITMFNSNTFIDVIRFLINSMDNMTYKVKVVCGKEKFKIYYMQQKNSQVNKVCECKCDADLLSHVLTACPNYIDFYLNSSKTVGSVEILSKIYVNRLKIFTQKTNQ